MVTVNVSTIGSGGTYPTIAAWEAATDNDLVTQDRIEVGELLNETHSTSATTVVIAGATTDATRYRILRAAAGAEYDPIADTGAKIAHTGAGHPVQVAEEGFRMERVGVSWTNASPTAANSGVAFSADAVNSNGTASMLTGVVVLMGCTNGSDLRGIGTSNNAYPVVWRNCIVIGDNTSGNMVYGLRGAVYPAGSEMSNCVCYGASFRGIRVDQDTASSVRNCVVAGGGGLDYSFTAGTTNLTLASLASSDATATGTGAVTSIVAEREFVDPRHNNFRGRAGGSLAGAGVDLSASFSTDIKGRPWQTWHIGCYAGLDTASPLYRVHSIGSGQDYATIALWEADTDNDLVAHDVIEVGELVSADHTAAGSITGATTDATHYRILRAAAGAEYDPAAGTGARVIQTGNANCMDIREEGFQCKGFAAVLQGTGQAAARACFLTFSDTTNANGIPVLIENCTALVEGVADFDHKGFDLRAVSLAASTVTRNCIAIGVGTAANNMDIGWLLDSNSSYGATVQNCVAYGASTYGFSAPDNVATDSFANCVAAGNGAAAFAYAGGAGNISFVNCASDDATAIGTGAVTGIKTHRAFIAAPLNDFRPQADGPLHQAGVNLSSSFTQDITQNAYGAKWNIGPYGQSVRNGNSRVNDTRIIQVVFASGVDWAFIDTRGYDYMLIYPIGGVGTDPTSGTITFGAFAVDSEFTVSDITDPGERAAWASMPNIAGIHRQATMTSTAVNFGYMKVLPTRTLLWASGGSGWSNVPVRVELHKASEHWTEAGRG